MVELVKVGIASLCSRYNYRNWLQNCTNKQIRKGFSLRMQAPVLVEDAWPVTLMSYLKGYVDA